MFFCFFFLGQSLCNACGIRQRKARRAMAAAAANGMAEPPPGKIKVQHKEKAAKIGNASQIKKRCKSTGVAAASMAVGSTQQKKICVEDFLISLSKKLSFHRVFPEDEKDAAILLMALSSGLVHGWFNFYTNLIFSLFLELEWDHLK